MQVLLSTMNSSPRKAVTQMNIQTDAIIINQTNKTEYKEHKINGKKILEISLPERGIGLSRNLALSRASADICLIADDDVVYVDGYEDRVISAFDSIPDADVIIFNVPTDNRNRSSYEVSRVVRVRRHNSLRYGAYRIAMRTDSIRRANVHFSLLFGGGAKYSSGEDSMFIFDCIRKGLSIYAVPVKIGVVSHGESTWFHGYTDKFFYDKGIFFGLLSPRWGGLLATQYVLRKYRTFQVRGEKTILQVFKLVMSGVKDARSA